MSNGSAIGQAWVGRRGLGRNSPQDRHRGPGLTPTVILTKRAPVGTWQGRRPGNGHTGTGGWAREAPAYGWLPRGLRREFRLGENSSPGEAPGRPVRLYRRAGGLGAASPRCSLAVTLNVPCWGRSRVPAHRGVGASGGSRRGRSWPKGPQIWRPGTAPGARVPSNRAAGAARGHIRREC
jgi:hypothetical protein